MTMNYTNTHFPPRMVFEENTYRDLEAQLDEIDAEFKVREVEVTFTKEKFFFNSVSSSADVYGFLKSLIEKHLEIQEHFIALFMNASLQIIGYYFHSKGTKTSTPIDIPLFVSVAIKTLSSSVIIAHNHPSGNLSPSPEDRRLTMKLKKGLEMFDIKLIDHLVITSKGYYSFADEGDSSLKGIDENQNSAEAQLRAEVLSQLKRVTPANSPNIHQMIQTESGYRSAEEMIIRKVLHDQMIPSAVIPLIEQQLDMI
jgi:DNA repair protein RadC